MENNISVEVLQSVGVENIEEYWKISRPHLKEDEIPSFDKIANIGLPVNGLCYYVLKINGPIFLRDLLYSVRPVQAWALSSRATPISKEVTHICSDINKLDKDAYTKCTLDLDEVFLRLHNGEKQEYVKTALPMSTQTTFIVGMDLRTLTNVLYTIQIHNKPFFDVFGNKVLHATGLHDLYWNNILPKKDIMSYICITDADAGITGHQRMGYMHAIRVKVTANLMAQLIRKNDAIIRNGLWNMFIEHPEILYRNTCNQSVDVVAYISDDSMKKMCSTRTCFFARMDKAGLDSWDSIIGEYVEEMTPQEFLEQLPCHGELPCTIEGDMIPRVDGREPNPPCAILVGDPSIIEQRIKNFGSNSRIMKKWLEVAKYIKYDVNNEYQKLYYKHHNERGDCI